MAVLEWLTQGVQAGALELRLLVEEENAVMGQRSGMSPEESCSFTRRSLRSVACKS
jgi:hypothetical protein